MEIQSERVMVTGTKFYVEEGGKEIARAYLYVLKNDLHDKPFGFMEDVFVEESHRERGIGSELVRRVVEEVRKKDCYKLIATSRYSREEVHEMYLRLGFKDYGKEFRMDFLKE